MWQYVQSTMKIPTSEARVMQVYELHVDDEIDQGAVETAGDYIFGKL